MIIFASEDIGLADPSALTIAIDAFRAVEVVGLPEANFAMSHAALYLSLAPKSNSVKQAIGAAKELVLSENQGEVPPHLRSGATEGDKEFGFGVGYVYPHSDPLAVVAQQYLPDGLEDSLVYVPKPVGLESELSDRLEKIDKILGKRPRT
jgi:putative ATPase